MLSYISIQKKDEKKAKKKKKKMWKKEKIIKKRQKGKKNQNLNQMHNAVSRVMSIFKKKRA